MLLNRNSALNFPSSFPFCTGMEPEMDKTISGWIAEYIIRRPLADHILKKLLSGLELPEDNTRLKKTVVLRWISDEIAEGSVSETILDSLQTIEELDSKEDCKITDSMKRAYCAVAVECTVKYLVSGGVNRRKYQEAVNRIWRERIRSLSGKSELVCSQELSKCREEVEAATWDKEMCLHLTQRNTRNDALTSVGEYVTEAFTVMGPPYLEKVAIRKITEMKEGPGTNVAGDGTRADNAQQEPHGFSDVVVQHDTEMVEHAEAHNFNGKETGEDVSRLLVSEGAVANGKVVVETGTALEEEGTRKTEKEGEEGGGGGKSEGTKRGSREEEICKVKELSRQKHARHWRCRGAKIFETGESDEELVVSKCSPVLTPEYNRVREELQTSVLELEAIVKDPLPDALQVAETVSAEMTKRDMNTETVVPVRNASGTAEGVNCGNQNSTRHNDARKCSLMARNSTACVHEWDNSSEETPGDRIRLPSPKRMAISPLRRQALEKIIRRRKPRKWSLEEEDVLRNAVKKYGKGNWKFILNAHRDVFLERTEVDLKDKWRNMTHYG
ncbi:uncharacterized protein LOC110811781 isoform X3 [Carica papaya]|uniref:uncharacterized protein LOC110811781 isoform X3 n=1 Tax=Carica papaya TaxID=3649 RepID=UPI000B8C9993|nr:uncharacterized protein LOC110811781 isoform X3 [Carica papaya]